MSWEKTTLGEISECIQPGPFGSQLHSSDYSDFGVPIIMPKDMVEGKISHANMCYVSEEHQRRLARHQVFDGDLLVARKGDVRKCVYITEDENGCLTGSDCLKVSLNKEKCHPKYIYYQLRSAYIGRWLEQISIGATMPSLNTGLLSSIELNIPSMEIQKKIADILSAYDDLIENNQKQIKLLEEAAQRLYKEWFVDLRFPGHEDVKIVDGVPAGWEKKSIDERISLLSGYAFKSTSFSENGKYKIITIKNVRDGEFDGTNTSCINELPNKMPEHCVLQEGDILLSLTGNVGRVCMVYGERYLLNQRVAKLQSKMPCYTYCLFRSSHMYDELNRLANGVAQQNLSPVRTGKVKINYPCKYVLQQFEMAVSPIMRKIIKLNKITGLAKQARDHLLPKLISGEIQV